MAHLVRIGNSYGVRIPQAIIQQTGFNKDMCLVFKITEEGLLISSKKQARNGWEQKFSLQENIENSFLLEDVSNQFDKEEWEW